MALQCGGQRYSSAGKWVERSSRREYQAGNLTGGEIVVVNGTDPTLGAYSAIQRTWTASSCTALTTSIRQYAGGGIEFVTEVSAQGARGFSRGSLYSLDGTLIASVAQEGLVRLRTK